MQTAAVRTAAVCLDHYAAVAMLSFQGDQCLICFASGETKIIWYQLIASTDTGIFSVSYTRNKFDMMQTP